MSNTYQIYLISDSTGETLDRIFFSSKKLNLITLNIKYILILLRELRIKFLKFLEDAEKNENSVILYTIVDNNLAKYLANVSDKKNTLLWCIRKFNFKFF